MTKKTEQKLIKQLDNLRISKGLSVKAFAESVGVTQQNMHNFLNSNHRPTLWIYLSILEGLGLKINLIKKGSIDLNNLEFGLVDILDVIKLEKSKYDSSKSGEDDALIQLDKLEKNVISSIDELYIYKDNLSKGIYEHISES